MVDDEAAIRDVVATALRHHGHRVITSGSGADALERATTTSFDLIVLDVMLPGLDGFEVCRRLRERGRLGPVLFLSARDESENRVEGFLAGGDDYLTKPFSVDELVLRVTAILRRMEGRGPGDAWVVDDLTVNESTHEAYRAGESIDLSPTEFRLLHYLVMNAGVVLSKPQILANVWDYAYEGSENVVELYVGYLRRKIDDGRSPLIHTKRGVGYVLQTAT